MTSSRSETVQIAFGMLGRALSSTLTLARIFPAWRWRGDRAVAVLVDFGIAATLAAARFFRL